jgi:hypothetical protein
VYFEPVREDTHKEQEDGKAVEHQSAKNAYCIPNLAGVRRDQLVKVDTAQPIY